MRWGESEVVRGRWSESESAAWWEAIGEERSRKAATESASSLWQPAQGVRKPPREGDEGDEHVRFILEPLVFDVHLQRVQPPLHLFSRDRRWRNRGHPGREKTAVSNTTERGGETKGSGRI